MMVYNSHNYLVFVGILKSTEHIIWVSVSLKKLGIKRQIKSMSRSLAKFQSPHFPPTNKISFKRCCFR
jgi:amino acid permease